MAIAQESDVIHLSLPARDEYIGVARLLVSGVANRMGFPFDDIEDIKLAVGEACTNAVRYAYKEGAQGAVHVHCLVYSERLVVIVADEGQHDDISQINQTREPISSECDVESLSEGGLGLYLIQSLMDDVQIREDKGVIVTMTKYVRRDEVTINVENFK